MITIGSLSEFFLTFFSVIGVYLVVYFFARVTCVVLKKKIEIGVTVFVLMMVFSAVFASFLLRHFGVVSQ